MRNKQRKNNRNKGNKGNVMLTIARQPTYKDQAIAEFLVPGDTAKFTTTVTSGVLAGASYCTAGNVVDWSTRFYTFDEYVIVACDWHITCLAATTGVSKFWIDEVSSVTPTQVDARERNCVIKSNNSANNNSTFVMKWRPKTIEDLQTYLTTNTTPVNSTLKVYTENAAFGAPVTVTDLWYVQPMFRILFKGLKTV